MQTASDKDRRSRLLSRSMVYVNQVGSGEASERAEQLSLRADSPSNRRAPAARSRRMSDFSEQTIARLSHLKLDELAAGQNRSSERSGNTRGNTRGPPQASCDIARQASWPTASNNNNNKNNNTQRQGEQSKMELAETQQEQPLVAISTVSLDSNSTSAHERHYAELSLANQFSQQQQQQEEQQASHLGELEHSLVEPTNNLFGSQHEPHSLAFPIVHHVGLGEPHPHPHPHSHPHPHPHQPHSFAYHEPLATPLFQHHHAHSPSAYYPLLGPARHADSEHIYSQQQHQQAAANYADLDETTRQRHHEQSEQQLKCTPSLPESVLRLNRLADRDQRLLSPASSQHHELHQLHYSNQNQSQGELTRAHSQAAQYYADPECGRHSQQERHLTVLSSVGRSASSAATGNHNNNNNNNNNNSNGQNIDSGGQHQLMSSSLNSTNSNLVCMAASEMRSGQEADELLGASLQSSGCAPLGCHGALATAASLEEARASELHEHELAADELKVCEWFQCGHTFLDMLEFVRHLEEAHVNQEPREKNRYFCLWANCKRNSQEFNARYKLLIHMRVHSGEKPYACKAATCNKSFSRLENLKIHVRSHTGDKPYKCTHGCAKSFTNSSDRIKHHKTHKDPKPYNCTIEGCTKRYTDPSSLRKHLRAHKRHGQQIQCSNSMSSTGDLHPGELQFEPLQRQRHSTRLSSCDLNSSSGYLNSSSYQNYNSPPSISQQQHHQHQHQQHAEVQYGRNTQAFEPTTSAGQLQYQLAADYDPTQDLDFTQTHQLHDNHQHHASFLPNAGQSADQQLRRSFCVGANSQTSPHTHSQAQQQQQQQPKGRRENFHDPFEMGALAARDRLHLAKQHQTFSHSWCAGAQRKLANARPLQRTPLNGSDNLLRGQTDRLQAGQWTRAASQQLWPSGQQETFSAANGDNNRQLQDTARWHQQQQQNQFVSSEQQQQATWRRAQHEQLMRSMPSGCESVATRQTRWPAAESSAQWHANAK